MTRLLSKPLVATALLSGPQRRHSHHRLLGFCAWRRGDAMASSAGNEILLQKQLLAPGLVSAISSRC